MIHNIISFIVTSSQCCLLDRVINYHLFVLQGLRAPDNTDNTDTTSAIVLATQWQRRLIRQRQREIADADKDDLGLRRIEEHRPPLLSQIFKTNPS